MTIPTELLELLVGHARLLDLSLLPFSCLHNIVSTSATMSTIHLDHCHQQQGRMSTYHLTTLELLCHPYQLRHILPKAQLL